jgi:ATP-dependent Clp protease ATP-binding subunit ClpA
VFERFTVGSRAVVVNAVAAAVDLGSPEVGTGHVLLALTTDPGVAGTTLRTAGVTDQRVRADLRAGRGGTDTGLDGAALASIGIDIDVVRRTVEQAFGPGALERTLSRSFRCRRPRTLFRRRRAGGRVDSDGRPGGHVPFSVKSKELLERSLREAIALRDRQIDPEHIMLGLLTDPASVAGRLLAAADVQPDRLRQTLLVRRGRKAG